MKKHDNMAAVLLAHYSQRHATLKEQGKYDTEYFIVRNSLKYWQRAAGIVTKGTVSIQN